MRKLTIKRTKNLIGCFIKIKVYVEDHSKCDLVIRKKPCRLLGVIKNGTAETFDIGNEATRIFVIADKISKEFCNELYELPAGDEDVVLTGENVFNPFQGNPFRFDGTPNQAVLNNRKKGMGIGIAVFAVAITLGAIIGAVGSLSVLSEVSYYPKTFTVYGMNITLTSNFKPIKESNYIASYSSRTSLVLVEKDYFDLYTGLGDFSIEEYGNKLIAKNNLYATLNTEDGLTYFKYVKSDDATKELYIYYAYIYKADDAFWVVQFVTINDNDDLLKEQFAEWAKTVEFYEE